MSEGGECDDDGAGGYGMEMHDDERESCYSIRLRPAHRLVSAGC